MSSSQIGIPVHNISMSVYMGLCLKIGTPEIVNIRRNTVDVGEFLLNSTIINRFEKRLESGSKREGFRLKGSDWDCMHWPDSHRVLWDFSQAHLYDTNRHDIVLILCDSTESPPGFTLLWLPLRRGSSHNLPALIRINGMIYISSAKYRELKRTSERSECTIHGPCSSGDFNSIFNGQLPPLEYDNAHCFVSDFWPPIATSWIDRCHSWPPPHVVDDIIRSGCHFVAIGHKLGNHVDNEWRISFSQAEYKLVYCMNHTQFLTYGLLKLFLKEIVHNEVREEEKLLCSYHMKTAIFWVIQQNTIAHWCPQNLLAGFWVCFKLLLKWVYEGVCPNFFIPENNMFLNNVHGGAQICLFTRLYSLYEKGIAFLLQSPSISSYIMKVFCNPRLSVYTDTHPTIYEFLEDSELFFEVFDNDACSCLFKFLDCIEALTTIEHLLGYSLTQIQILMIRKTTCTLLGKVVLEVHSTHACRSGTVNRNMYNLDKKLCHMLKLAVKFGFASDMLYLAIYYYATLRYREALAVIRMAKEKFSVGFFIHAVDPLVYLMTISGLSWSFKMKRVVPPFFRLNNKICYLMELTKEYRSVSQTCRTQLRVPPLVLCHMLEFLCYRHVDPLRQQVVLDNLQALIQHNEGDSIHIQFRDISWQILGICQQITGNYQAALYSYQQSLNEIPFNRIQTATRERMDHLRSFH